MVDQRKPSAARLRRWQGTTAVALFIGYVGYYVCRSNLSVATPLLLDEYGDDGLNKIHIGWINTVGVLLYALGKITNGLWADFRGGRALFLGGMFASIVCTLLFPLGGTVFAAAGLGAGLAMLIGIWSANRYVQSMGWVALVKIASRWYPVSLHATIMGAVSMSYLLGDVFARFYLGSFIKAGASWQQVFLIAAATFTGIALFSLATLRSSPGDVGEEEPAANPANVYGAAGETSRPPNLGALLAPLVASRVFWIVCLINAGVTLIRETFNSWTPTYLNEVAELSPGNAAIGSLMFPLVGAVASLVAGRLSDLLGGRHSRIIVPSLVLLIATLLVMGVAPATGRPVLALTLIGCAAFFLIAPYSFLSGVIALDLGGKQGSSTAAGLIDSAGYLGGTIAGVGIGAIAEIHGWGPAMLTLAAVAGLTLVAAVAYWLRQRREPSSSREPDIG